MHSSDKARETAGVTKYATVDAIQLVRAACEAIGDMREIEVVTEDTDMKLSVRIKTY